MGGRASPGSSWLALRGHRLQAHAQYIVPSHLEPLADISLCSGWREHRIDVPYRAAATCVALPPGARVFFAPHFPGGATNTNQQRQAHTAAMRAAVFKRLRLVPAPRLFVYIDRHVSARALKPAVLGSLRAWLPRFKFEVYHGNESMADTGALRPH